MAVIDRRGCPMSMMKTLRTLLLGLVVAIGAGMAVFVLLAYITMD